MKENVAIHLRAFGEQQRLRPNECEPARDHLFRIVAETASKKKGRVLSRDDFRLEFEQATSKRYSASELAALTAGAGLLQQTVSASLASGGDVILAAATLVQIGVPSLPPDFVKRAALVNKVLNVASTFGGAVIKGSSGMGKSTLAKLAATSAGGQWIWADFQGIDPDNVPQLVRLFANYFIASRSAYNLALDNLNFDVSDLASVDNSLAAVVRSVRSRGGKFIITTQRDLPGRLLQKMSLAKESVIGVPYFTESEVEQFCQALGCSNTEQASLLAKIVRVQTSGHPQLVHARLVGLALNSWPLAKAADIITQPPEVIQELDVARQLLDDAPTDDKQLLYRLSITTGWFRKDHVLAIAQVEPPLGFAGDAFTRLVGPWIETVGGEYFRLSPLLSKAAEHNWPADKVLSFRSSIARAILSCGKKTLLEANEVLLQGLLAQDEVAVSSVALGLGRAPLSASPQIADQFFWLTAFGHENGKMVFPKNPFLNLLLRLLQFRILVERSPGDVDWLCKAIDDETAQLEKEIKTSSRIMWTSQAMIFYQAKIRPKTLIAYWSETFDLLAADASFEKLAKKTAKAMEQADGFGTTDFLGNNLLMILARDSAPEYLLEFAIAVDALPPAKKDAAIGYLRQIPRVLQLAVDRSWIKESDKANPNWNSALTCFDSIRQLAVKWQLVELAALAHRAIAVVEDEYLNHPDKALEAAEKGIALASNQTHVLEDQKAMIFYRQNRYPEALRIWGRILPNWPIQRNSHEIQPLFVCQRAGSAAGQIPDWPLAANFFEQGQRLAKILGSRLHELTFLADEAFVRWKLGEKGVAVAKLAYVVTSLGKLKLDDEDDFQFHRAWKSIEQVVKWCRKDSGEVSDTETFEPPVGFCSKPEGHEKLRDIPKAPIDFMWLFLAQIEFQLGLGKSMFDVAMKRVSVSNNASFRGAMARLNLTVLFRDRDFGSLIEGVLALHKAFVDVQTEIPNLPPKPMGSSQISLIEEALICAFATLAASEAPLDKFLPQWFEAIGKVSSDMEVRIRQVLDSNHEDICRTYKDATQGRLVRMIAALRMAIDTEAELVSMFLGQASLLGELPSGGFKEEVSEAMGTIVKRTWKQRLNFPAEFPTPRITIPPIKVACDDLVTGYRLASRILLQARFAVPLLRIPPEAVQQLELLAR